MASYGLDKIDHVKGRPLYHKLFFASNNNLKIWTVLKRLKFNANFQFAMLGKNRLNMKQILPDGKNLTSGSIPVWSFEFDDSMSKLSWSMMEESCSADIRPPRFETRIPWADTLPGLFRPNRVPSISSNLVLNVSKCYFSHFNIQFHKLVYFT